MTAEHGTTRGYRNGCRCQCCRDAVVAFRKAHRLSPGDGDPRHGTKNGYGNLYCRCEACTKAWAEYHHSYMNAKPERLEAHAFREALRRASLRRTGRA